jgi:hypothetical protein
MSEAPSGADIIDRCVAGRAGAADFTVQERIPFSPLI